MLPLVGHQAQCPGGKVRRQERDGGVTKANSLSHLVVVGSSAGGIEALSELVSTLPEDLPVPVVIRRELKRFLEELEERQGVDFRSYKPPTITRRLKRGMAATGA